MEYWSKEFLEVGLLLPFVNERANNLLMLLNVGSTKWFKLLFFACVVISDLYLFQEINLLNACFIFSKNLILSLIDKVTTEIYGLALFIWNVAPVVSVTTCCTGASQCALKVLDISQVSHLFDYDKTKFSFTS